jgi:hypothetical protein
MPLDLSTITNWDRDKFIVKNVSGEYLSIGDLKVYLSPGSERDLLEQNDITKIKYRTFPEISKSRHLKMYIQQEKVEIYDEKGIVLHGGSALNAATTGSAYDSINEKSVKILTDDYTMTQSDGVLLCNGTFDLTLLPAADAFEEMDEDSNFYNIKNIGNGIITVKAYGNETIDDDTDVILNIKYENIKLVSDGTEWYIL